MQFLRGRLILGRPFGVRTREWGVAERYRSRRELGKNRAIDVSPAVIVAHYRNRNRYCPRITHASPGEIPLMILERLRSVAIRSARSPSIGECNYDSRQDCEGGGRGRGGGGEKKSPR